MPTKLNDRPTDRLSISFIPPSPRITQNNYACMYFGLPAFTCPSNPVTGKNTRSDRANIVLSEQISDTNPLPNRTSRAYLEWWAFLFLPWMNDVKWSPGRLTNSKLSKFRDTRMHYLLEITHPLSPPLNSNSLRLPPEEPTILNVIHLLFWVGLGWLDWK